MEYKRSVEEFEIDMDRMKTIGSSGKCLICGEENAKYAYGVQSCASCKIFFRRNVHLDLNTNACIFGEECHITIKNRHLCRFCRLKKCLSVGMNKYLLRASHGAQGGIKAKTKLFNKQITFNEKQTSSMFFIYPIDSFCHDRSLLTVDQWSLLSNVNNAYNNRSPIENIRYIMSSQAIFPLKLRLKVANNYVMDILHSMYSFVEPFIKIVPEFSSMSINDQNSLMKRNIQNLGGFNCQFMMYETNMLNDCAYSNSLSSTYGSWIFDGTVKIVQDFEFDQIFFKLLLVVLAFSTCSDIVIPEYKNRYNRISDYNLSDNMIETTNLSINSKYLFEIQNRYVEIMFKYMIYRYGYYQAALRLAMLMKKFLYQSVLSANATVVSKHHHMIKSIMYKTEQLSLSQI